MGNVVLLAFLSAFNPTLLAVIAVMLLLPNPRRLMLGYWLGAMLTSITIGLLIVFSLHSSGAVSTTKKTLSPLADTVLGGLALVLALTLASGRDKRLAARRAKRNQDKKPPRWRRALQRGTAKTTFVIGAALTLPGASYLVGLNRLSKLHRRNGGGGGRLQPGDADLARRSPGRVCCRAGLDPQRDRPRQGLGRYARPAVRHPGPCRYRRSARSQGDHRPAAVIPASAVQVLTTATEEQEQSDRRSSARTA